MSALPAPSHARYRTPAPPLSGVGGWLALFIFGTVLVSGLSVLVDVDYLEDVATLRREFPSIHAVSIFYLMDHIAWLAIRCYGIYAGIQLWRIAPGAVEAAKRFLVLFGLVALAQFVGLLIVYGVGGPAASTLTHDSSSGNVEIMMNFVSSAIYSLVWYSYFVKSVRVQNTYARIVPAAPAQGVPS